VDNGFDLYDDLAALGAGAPATGFIERFAARYAGALGPGDGCSPGALDAAEARLGVPLPEALRDLYTLVGNRDDLTRGQDELLAPEHLHVDGDVLVFRRENQNVALWGVPVSAHAEPDPPVRFRFLGAPSGADREWHPFLDRVSWAAVELVLSEWLLSEGHGDNRELDADAVAALEQRYRRLPVPDHPVWADPDGPPTRWFGGADVLLRDDGGEWLWVRARTAEALDAARSALPGDWLGAG
jgi:hypothetical protein